MPEPRAPLEPIRLLTDQPVDGSAATDHLSTEGFARIVAGTALGTPGPFTIGVYGGWGQGKTSLLKQAQDLLDHDPEAQKTVVTVWFNAWQYEREEHPLFPLLAAVIAALPAEGEGVFQSLHNCLKSLLSGVKLSFKPLGVGLDLDLSKALAADAELQDSVLERETMYPRAFETLRQVSKDLEGQGKVVVFIDDLDRCLPSNAVKLLESIKLVLAQPGFVFVLALDHTIVESFLAKRFREDFGVTDPSVPKTYLHKLVQLEFPVPDHRARFADYIERLLETHEDAAPLREPAVREALVAATDNTPRSLVRLVNALLVDFRLWREFVPRAEYDTKWSTLVVLASMIVAREAYRRLGRAVFRRLVDDQDLCASLLQDGMPGDEPEVLARFGEDYRAEGKERTDLARNLRGLMDLMRDQGRVWLEDQFLRQLLYGFYREREVVSDDPETQQAILERAVRDALGLGLNDPIPPDRLQRITRLSLMGESDFGDAGMPLVAKLTSLRTLRLGRTPVTDLGLAHLSGLTGLQVLGLDRTQATDAGLAHLAGMTGLQLLDLSGTQVTDAGLAHLAGLIWLQWLYLNDTEVSNDGLARLTGLIWLQWLYLNSTQVGNDGLAHLAGLTGLETLHLSRTQLTDAGLAHLAGLIRLQELYLSGTSVTDAGLAHLAGLNGLQALGLNGTQVTDAGLVHLAGLTGLQWLWLSGTQVSDAGVEELRQKLPNCQIFR